MTVYPPPALTIALDDFPSCGGTGDRPHTNRRTILGAGPRIVRAGPLIKPSQAVTWPSQLEHFPPSGPRHRRRPAARVLELSLYKCAVARFTPCYRIGREKSIRYS
jgi:hypothetical protein